MKHNQNHDNGHGTGPQMVPVHFEFSHPTAKTVALDMMRFIQEAAQNAVAEASKTIRNIRSVYIKDFNAEVENGKITNFRITGKVTFAKE